MRLLALALALAASLGPAQAGAEWGVQQPPARLFAERALDTLGDSFVDQLAVPRARTAAPPQSILPEPDGYAVLLSALGLLLFVVRRRRKALHAG